ncbi:MAG: four helix bundle protein, partial [Candidatus Moraniibacteriota bacterium]
KVQSYKDLIVWQKAMNLVVEIYAITEKFPQQELFVLTSQMRRAAISIPSNIAEGRRRGTRKDYRQFLLIAYGSGSELETQIEIAKRLSLGKSVDFSQADLHLDEVMRMLNVMVHKLGSQPTS